MCELEHVGTVVRSFMFMKTFVEK